MIKNIVSDLGGCLFLCNFKHIAEGLAEQSSLSWGKIEKIITQGSDYKDFEKGLIIPEIFYKRMKEKIKFRNSFEVFKKIWMEHFFLVNKEYAKILLNLLKNGYKIYCLSNINEMHWKAITSNFYEMAFFHGCFLSFQMKKVKPHLEIYEEMVIKTGNEPDKSLFIDDKEENIKGAKKAGMRALLYCHKKHAEFEKTISDLL